MVQDKPHFQDCLRKIQKIFDRSQMVLGFALDNDIRILEQSGVTGLVQEKCLDVRELFWGVYGDELAMDFYHVPSLIKCAEFCGYVWEEGSAHSAAADAKATLYCYEVLMRKFIQKYELCQLPDEQEKLTDEQIYLGWRRLQEMVRVELHNRAVEKAKGWLYLIDCPEGVLLVARKKPLAARKSKPSADGTGAGKDTGIGAGIATATATGNDAYGAPSRGEAGQSKSRVLAGIELADYAKGYDVMYARFKDKMLPHGPGEKNYYRLTEADIEEFKLYTNVFEA